MRKLTVVNGSKMRNSVCFVVYLILTLGSGNQAALQVTTADDNVTESSPISSGTGATFPANSSSSSATPHAVNLTAMTTVPTMESTGTNTSATSAQSTTSASRGPHTSGQSSQPGVGQTTFPTTASPGPWKATTYALSGLSAVLLVTLTVVVLVFCKMRTRLHQASKTLYPITPNQEDHEYLDLDESNKKGVRVELTHMTVHHEEEIDSPTISPTPPEKPKRKPPAVPDEAPTVPARTKNKVTKSKSSPKNLGGTKPSDSKAGEINPGFVEDNVKQRKGKEIPIDKSSNSDISLYEEEDELYEQYEHSKSAGLSFAIGGMDNDDFEIQRPYEEPVKSSARTISAASQPINRQGSSSGLPDLPLQKVSSKEGLQDVPLQVANEEVDNIEDFGAVESGLPNMTGMHNFDEDEFFDDPDKMTTQETSGENNEITDDSRNVSGDEDMMAERNAPSPTEESLDDILTYDDADMVLADDDQPGCYEDFDTSRESEGHVNIPSAPNEQTSLPTFADRSRSTTEDSIRGNEQGVLPIVPPRRDLKRKQSGGESVVGSFDEMVLAGASQQEANHIPENEVHLRPGRQVSEQGQARPRDSYFLFMDDKTVEMSENNTRKVSSTDAVDLSGLSAIPGMSGTPQISVDLSELQSTGIGLVPNLGPFDSKDADGERDFLDMFTPGVPGSGNGMHVNGRLPNTNDGDGF